VKASKQSIGRSVDQPDPSIRFYLLYGPDEAQSRALGARLAEALNAERFIVASGAVKSDPALLADEAGALSLFGGRRVIWIEPAGEEISEGASALLEANGAESPVVAIAGALRKTSGLLKLAEASPHALTFAAYVPEGADAQRMVTDVARQSTRPLRLRHGSRGERKAGPTRSGTPPRCRRAAARHTITPKPPASGDVGSPVFERCASVRYIESPREEYRWSTAERSCHWSPAAWPPRDGLSHSRRPRRSRSTQTSGPI